MRTSDTTPLDHCLQAALTQPQCGHLQQAQACDQYIIQHDPYDAEAHYHLGNALRTQGQLDAAIASYQQALRLQPDNAETHNSLGIALQMQDHLEAAIASHRHALRLQPHFVPAHNSLGIAFHRQGLLTEAVASFEAALRLHPRFAEAHNNLGNVLHAMGEYDAAVAHFTQALELKPHFIKAHYNLGNTLEQLGQFDAALRHHEYAIALQPDFAEAHWNRALVWLRQGNLTQGWQAYEWRFRLPGAAQRAFPYPRWDGASLTGRTILVHAEQGVGDELLFASCFPDLVEQARHVIIECDPRLASLLARSFPRATVYGSPRDDLSWLTRALPIDVQIVAGSLPGYLRPSLDWFPTQAGFLTPDASMQRHWQARLDRLGPGLNVGMAWRSRMTRVHDPFYTHLAQWVPLLSLPGIHWVNLQYDDPTAELAAVQRQHGISIRTWSDLDLLNDFDQTAALMAVLDLVIAPEMMMAALAGSVGTKVWQLMSYAGSWPMLGTTGQPWFPNTHVFCQSQRGDWNRVLAQVAGELTQLTKRL